MPQTLEQCIKGAMNPGADQDSSFQQTLTNVGTLTSGAEASKDLLTDAGAAALGRTLGNGPLPGTLLSPEGAAYAALGAQMQRTLSALNPYLKIGGTAIGIGSIGAGAFNGYRTGGIAGASIGAAYSSVDFALEVSMSATGPWGIAAAVGYDRAGGSRTIGASLLKAGAINGCLATNGFPTAE